MTPPGGGASRSRFALALLLGLAAVVGAVALSCLLGPQPISASAAWAGVEPDRAILFGLRLPRAALAALVGLALAAAGTALQALLRNPLAEPFMLGVSGGAALGGTLTLLASVALSAASSTAGALLGSAPPVVAGAVLGALLTTPLVFGLGRIGGRLVPEAAKKTWARTRRTSTPSEAASSSPSANRLSRAERSVSAASEAAMSAAPTASVWPVS